MTIVTHKALFADIIAGRARGLTEEQSRSRAFAAGTYHWRSTSAAQQTARSARARRISRFESAKPFWKLPGRDRHGRPWQRRRPEHPL